MKLFKALLFSFVFLLVSNLSSQIIYTDIIPDTVLLRPPIPLQSGGSTNLYDFDINNDSFIDLTFHLSVSKYLLPDGSQYQVIITEAIISNGTITFLNATYNYNCMKVLDQYDTIDMNQYWSIGNYASIISGQDYYVQNKHKEVICNSSNSNKFCGIKFYNNGNYYYGWIRLSWTGSYVKVHDFAYNANPDELILAGQTELSSVDQYSSINSLTISIQNGELEIKNYKEENIISRIRLLGLSGQCIRDVEINNFTASININNLQAGFYIVQIIQPENLFVQKVFISNN